MASEPSLPELISSAIASALLDVHVSIPAVVKKYDPTTQTCDAQPVTKRALKKLDSELKTEEIPTIQNIPVVFPRGNGFAMTFPLLAGDHVMLLFSETSFAQWRSNGILSEPGDVKRFPLSYPVALPGLSPSLLALQSASATKMLLGSDTLPNARIEFDPIGNPTEPISLGDSGALHLAQAELVDLIATSLQTVFSTWVPAPVAGDGGAAIATQIKGIVAAWVAAPTASKIRTIA